MFAAMHDPLVTENPVAHGQAGLHSIAKYDKPFRRGYSKPLETIKAGKLLLLLAGVSMNK